MRLIPLLVVALAMTGCASVKMERMVGSQVLPPNSIDDRREEPGHNLVIDEALIGSRVTGIDVALGTMPRPLPPRWLEELVDQSRLFAFWVPKVGHRGNDALDCNDPETPNRREICQEERRVLKRIVFRAVMYRDETAIGVYRAVINSKATQSVTLIPNGQGKTLGDGVQQLLISSDGTFGVTTRGMTVDLSAVKDLRRLPKGFFERFPSPVSVVSRDINTAEGYGFIAGLRQMFPDLLTHEGKQYRGRPEAYVVWRKFTSLAYWPDRIITCVSYRAGPNPLDLTVGNVVALGQAVNAVWIQDDCLKPYLKGEPTKEVAP